MDTLRRLARSRARTFALAVIALLTLIACDRQPEMEGASGGAQPVLVEQAASGGFAVERRTTGLVRAERELVVTTREPGQVTAVAAPADSQPVRTGQALLHLVSPELDLELAEARSVLESLELTHDRQRQLADLGLASRTQVDESRSQAERAKIVVDRLLLRHSHLLVSSPASGVLLHSSMPSAGQFCAAGLEVARVVDLDSVVVEVTIPATWNHELDQISSAVLELGGSDEVEATVQSLSAAVDPERGGRILTLRPASAAGLAPDSRLPVRLVFAARNEAVTVPVEALVLREGDWVVYIGPSPGERGGIRLASVVPGPTDGRRTVIEEGLEAGDWVVLASDLESVGWGWGSFIGVAR